MPLNFLPECGPFVAGPQSGKAMLNSLREPPWLGQRAELADRTRRDLELLPKGYPPALLPLEKRLLSAADQTWF